MVTLLKSIPFNIINAAPAAPLDGTVYALPVLATQLTWQTSFIGTASGVSIQLFTSNDGVNFNLIDSSALAAGESRTLITSAAFIKAKIVSITGASSVTVTVIAEPSHNDIGSGGGGSGGAPAAHAPSHYNAASDPVDVKQLAGYPGGTSNYLRADGTFATPTTGVPGAHHTTHEPGGGDPLSNVAWTNLANVFTALRQTVANTDSVARFCIVNNTLPLNQRKWMFWVFSDLIGLGQFFDDDTSGGQPSFEFHRDGRFLAPGKVQVTALRPEVQLQNTGDTSKSHLEVATPNNFAITNNLYYDGTQWQRDDIAFPGTLINLVGGALNVYTTPAGANPATLTQILGVSATGNVIVPGNLTVGGTLSASGSIPTAHHATHEPGGVDALVNAVWANLINIFTQGQTISLPYPWLRLNDPGQPANARLFQIDQQTGIFFIEALDDSAATSQGRVSMDRTGVWFVSAGLGATPLNASQLASGSVPDARLSANVALLNRINTFTQILTAAAGLGATPLDANQLISGTVPDARLSANVQMKPLPPPVLHHTTHEPGGSDQLANAAWTNLPNNFVSEQQIDTHLKMVGAPFITWSRTGNPVDVNKWHELGAYPDGTFRIYPVNDAESIQQSVGFILDRASNASFGGSILERGRVVPVGEWTDFTPVFTGGGAITINNLITARYTLIGKTMTVSVYCNVQTSISENTIRMNIPGGFVASNTMHVASYANPGSTGSGSISALMGCGVGVNTISFVLAGGVGYIVGAQWLTGVLVFSVQ